MNRRRRDLVRLGLLGPLVAACPAVRAQSDAAPGPGPELDVPYVVTPQAVVDAMLELAEVGPGDRLLDLGCGDGRIVVSAAVRWGTHGLGVDNDPSLVERARRNARDAGVADRARFAVQDLFETDLAQASVITMYLLPDVNLALRPRLRRLRPGTRIVSHDWHMGDWAPRRAIEVPAPGKTVAPLDKSRLMLWVVDSPDAGA